MIEFQCLFIEFNWTYLRKIIFSGSSGGDGLTNVIMRTNNTTAYHNGIHVL